MAEMTWEQKLEALKALTSTHLEMRAPCDWYVSAFARSIGGNGLLRSEYGSGSTPALAVEDDFQRMADVQYPLYIEIGRSGKTRRVRWGGFMWVDIPESENP